MTPACPACGSPMRLNHATVQVPAGIWWVCCDQFYRRHDGEHEMQADHPLKRLGVVR